MHPTNWQEATDEMERRMRKGSATSELLGHELLRRLREELRLCQRRLGTPAEKSDDFERVRALAHKINNRIAIARLRADLGVPTHAVFIPPPAPLLA